MSNNQTAKLFHDQLLKHWRGVPIRLCVAQETYNLGGSSPRTTVYLRGWSQVRRILHRPSLAFGEGYVRGEIEINGELGDVLSGFMTGSVGRPYWKRLISTVSHHVPTSVKRAVVNAQHHYDIGNDFFKLWLDSTRTYSCAYFETGDESLDDAQRKKFDLLCRKLRLERGQRLLDIGCGWGGLIFHAVENYGVRATGVTASREQARFVSAEAQRRGMGDQVSVVETDWRGMEGRFDRIVSVGMFEHVGRRQYSRFLSKWNEMLGEDGYSVLHTISRRLPEPVDPWIRRYIFPGGDLPTCAQVMYPATMAGLRLLRGENLRPHYARTLAAWSDNFLKVRAEVVRMFDEEFARMWWLYLQASQVSFQLGDLDLLQFEFCGRDSELPASRELPAGVICNALPAIPANSSHVQLSSPKLGDYNCSEAT